MMPRANVRSVPNLVAKTERFYTNPDGSMTKLMYVAMFIGVCNETNNFGWGLCLDDGTLLRESTANGQLIGTPPAEGWPDGDGTQVMVNEAGQPASLLNKRANGAVVEVVVDHSDGSLAFGVNGAPPQRVPDEWPRGYNVYNPPAEPPAKVPFKFPQGAQLRPWAFLWDKDDHVSFLHRYLDER